MWGLYTMILSIRSFVRSSACLFVSETHTQNVVFSKTKQFKDIVPTED